MVDTSERIWDLQAIGVHRRFNDCMIAEDYEYIDAGLCKNGD